MKPLNRQKLLEKLNEIEYWPELLANLKSGHTMNRVALVLFSIFFSTTANSASFDCSKASKKVEKIICSEAELGKLDEELSSTYKTFLNLSSKRQLVAAGQKTWLAEVNKCENSSCISENYISRIAELPNIVIELECQNANTTMDLNACESSQVSMYDALIANKIQTYASGSETEEVGIYVGMKKELVRALKESQTAWVKYREKMCLVAEISARGGSGNFKAACEIRLSKARLSDIRESHQ